MAVVRLEVRREEDLQRVVQADGRRQLELVQGSHRRGGTMSQRSGSRGWPHGGAARTSEESRRHHDERTHEAMHRGEEDAVLGLRKREHGRVRSEDDWRTRARNHHQQQRHMSQRTDDLDGPLGHCTWPARPSVRGRRGARSSREAHDGGRCSYFTLLLLVVRSQLVQTTPPTALPPHPRPSPCPPLRPLPPRRRSPPSTTRRRSRRWSADRCATQRRGSRQHTRRGLADPSPGLSLS